MTGRAGRTARPEPVRSTRSSARTTSRSARGQQTGLWRNVPAEVVGVRAETDVDDRARPCLRTPTSSARALAVLREPHDERASREVEDHGDGLPVALVHLPDLAGRNGRAVVVVRVPDPVLEVDPRPRAERLAVDDRLGRRGLPRHSRSTETPQARRSRGTSAGRAGARRRPRGAGRRGSPPSPRPFAAGGRSRRGSRRPAPTGAARPDGERGSARVCARSTESGGVAEAALPALGTSASPARTASARRRRTSRVCASECGSLSACLRTRRDGTGHEPPTGEKMSELVRLAPCTESRRRSQQREDDDQDAETRAERGRARRGTSQKAAARKLAPTMFANRGGRASSSWSLAEERLHELEVREARKAVAAPERQTDDELQRQQAEEPRPAGDDRDERERSDDDLVEARRAGVDDVEVAVRIRESCGVRFTLGSITRV